MVICGMKQLTILLLSVVLIGCEQPNVKKTDSGIVLDVGSNKLQIVEIESCEYLFYVGGHRMALTHKGNCKNPIHQNRK